MANSKLPCAATPLCFFCCVCFDYRPPALVMMINWMRNRKLNCNGLILNYHFLSSYPIASILWIWYIKLKQMTHTVKEQCHPLAIASIVTYTDFIPIYVCRSYHWGITTIPKNGMLGVTELSYHFWYDIHTSFFTVCHLNTEAILLSPQ